MKVQIKVTIEVDPADWAEEFGLERSEVRTDVKNYFSNAILQSAAVDEVDFTVRVS